MSGGENPNSKDQRLMSDDQRYNPPQMTRDDYETSLIQRKILTWTGRCMSLVIVAAVGWFAKPIIEHGRFPNAPSFDPTTYVSRDEQTAINKDTDRRLNKVVRAVEQLTQSVKMLDKEMDNRVTDGVASERLSNINSRFTSVFTSINSLQEQVSNLRIEMAVIKHEVKRASNAVYQIPTPKLPIPYILAYRQPIVVNDKAGQLHVRYNKRSTKDSM